MIRRSSAAKPDTERKHEVVATLAAINNQRNAVIPNSEVDSALTTPARLLNVTFGADPGHGNHDGVLGKPDDTWNLVSMGTTAKDFMRYADVSGDQRRSAQSSQAQQQLTAGS